MKRKKINIKISVCNIPDKCEYYLTIRELTGITVSYTFIKSPL